MWKYERFKEPLQLRIAGGVCLEKNKSAAFAFRNQIMLAICCAVGYNNTCNWDKNVVYSRRVKYLKMITKVQ